MPDPLPSSRKAAGAALIVLLIVLWAAFVASLAQMVEKWPILVQALFYLFMGIAWIIPLKPLLRWSESGRWTRPNEPVERDAVEPADRLK